MNQKCPCKGCHCVPPVTGNPVSEKKCKCHCLCIKIPGEKHSCRESFCGNFSTHCEKCSPQPESEGACKCEHSMFEDCRSANCQCSLSHEFRVIRGENAEKLKNKFEKDWGNASPIPESEGVEGRAFLGRYIN